MRERVRGERRIAEKWERGKRGRNEARKRGREGGDTYLNTISQNATQRQQSVCAHK